MTKEIKVRAAEDSADKPRNITTADVFAEYDPESAGAIGALDVDLGEDLFGFWVDPKNPDDIAKASQYGYKPVDVVEAQLGRTIEGVYHHKESGARLKLYVCYNPQRLKRIGNEKKRLAAEVQRAYADDIAAGRSAPILGKHDLPPGH